MESSLTPLLSAVKPEQAVYLLGFLWLMRELFGFTRAVLKDRQAAVGPTLGTEEIIMMRLIKEALERVGTHMEESTKLLQTFGHQLNELRNEVKDIRERQDRRTPAVASH